MLVTDFWAAYGAVGRTKQKCWPHLLREREEVDARSDNGGDWPAFAERLRRIDGDAIRLGLRRPTLPADEFGMKRPRLHSRITNLAIGDRAHAHACRLAKRLHEYGVELLTFVVVRGRGRPRTTTRSVRCVRRC